MYFRHNSMWMAFTKCVIYMKFGITASLLQGSNTSIALGCADG